MKKLIFFLLIAIFLVSTPNVKGFMFNCKGYELGLDFCYEVKYDIESCTEYVCYQKIDLIEEGEKVIYWPKVSVTGFSYSEKGSSYSFNETYHPGNLLIVYYFVYPSGERSERRIVWISDPEVNLEGFQNGTEVVVSSKTAIGGISIPSDYPGVIELRTVVASTAMNIEEIDESLFETRKVHILSHSEVLNEEISRNSLLVSIFALIIAIIMAFLTFYKDYKRQISLLESLHSELEAISSKKRKIELLDLNIDTTGNLQWVKELFGYELKHAHGIWKLNVQTYVGELNNKIKFNKTKDLKRVLIHISQKIEMIENYFRQYEGVPKDHQKAIKEAIIKVVDETIKLVETGKKFIEDEFGIHK